MSALDELMTEIERLRLQPGQPLPPIKRATTLLTRYWGAADGQSRDEILRAARWLLRLGTMQSVMVPQIEHLGRLGNGKARKAGAEPGKRKKRKRPSPSGAA